MTFKKLNENNKYLIYPVLSLAEKFQLAKNNNSEFKISDIRNYLSHYHHNYTIIYNDYITSLKEKNLLKPILDDVIKKQEHNNIKTYLQSINIKDLQQDINNNESALLLLYISTIVPYEFIKITIDKIISMLDEQISTYFYNQSNINKDDFLQEYFLFKTLANLMQYTKYYNVGNKKLKLFSPKSPYIFTSDKNFSLVIKKVKITDESNQESKKYQYRFTIKNKNNKLKLLILDKYIDVIKINNNNINEQEIKQIYDKILYTLATQSNNKSNQISHILGKTDYKTTLKKEDIAIYFKKIKKHIEYYNKLKILDVINNKLTKDFKSCLSATEQNNNFLLKSECKNYKFLLNKDNKKNYHLEFVLLLSLYNTDTTDINNKNFSILTTLPKIHKLCDKHRANDYIDLSCTKCASNFKQNTLKIIRSSFSKSCNFIGDIFDFEKQYLNPKTNFTSFNYKNIIDENIIQKEEFDLLKEYRNTALHFCIPINYKSLYELTNKNLFHHLQNKPIYSNIFTSLSKYISYQQPSPRNKQSK